MDIERKREKGGARAKYIEREKKRERRILSSDFILWKHID